MGEAKKTRIDDAAVTLRVGPLPFLMVLATTISCAAFLLSRFLQHPRLLWSDVIHDRNAHLLSGISLSYHLKQGAWSQVFADLDSFRSWPILHDGFCVGLCLVLGQGDERWAILPSLLAWVGSVLFAYLLAHRACVRNGWLAGLVAALFVLVSPAQRAYATDVMLESLGACLTLACLYTYVAARQTDSPRDYRNLALVLTLLFLEKYNYWLLVAFALAADWIASEPSRYHIWWKAGKVWLSGRRGRAGLLRQAHRPLNYLIAFLVGLMLVITLAHWDETTLGRHRIRLAPVDNLLLGIYVLVVIRLIPWYRSRGRVWLAGSNHRVRALVTWHVWPILLWFLWPHHLYAFIWFNNPAANAGAFPHHDWFGGYPYYALCLMNDYHMGVWSGVMATGLFVVGGLAATRGRLRPGAAVVFWMVLIAFFLTIHHPLRQSRFLHTWLPVLWVGTGIGTIKLIPQGWGKRNALTTACSLSGVGLLYCLHYPGLWAEAHAPEGGILPPRSSALDVTDAYLPDLIDSHSVAVFSNLPIKQLVQWTYLQCYNRTKRLETEVSGFLPFAVDNHPTFDTWLQKTDRDTVVYVDFAPGSRFYQVVPGCENLRQYGEMLEKQTVFTRTARHVLSQDGVTITVWKRKRPVQR